MKDQKAASIRSLGGHKPVPLYHALTTRHFRLVVTAHTSFYRSVILSDGGSMYLKPTLLALTHTLPCVEPASVHSRALYPARLLITQSNRHYLPSTPNKQTKEGSVTPPRWRTMALRASQHPGCVASNVSLLLPNSYLVLRGNSMKSMTPCETETYRKRLGTRLLHVLTSSRTGLLHSRLQSTK